MAGRGKSSSIMLNGEAIKRYLESKKMSQPRFASELDMNYSYLYRLIKGDRKMGLKTFLNLQKYCEKKGLDYRDFIIDTAGGSAACKPDVKSLTGTGGLVG